MEKLTPTDKVLYRNLGLSDGNAVSSVFPKDFETEELLTSMHTMGEILFQALQGEPVRETRNSLIRFGVLAATVLDESRISLSLVEAQGRIQVNQGLSPLNRTKRDLMHRDYATALQQGEADAQTIYSRSITSVL